MAQMIEIEKRTQEYSAARRVLVDRMQTLEDEIAKIKRRLLPGIKAAAESAAQFKAVLIRAIEDSPELFDAPRTQVYSGIKVGLQKGKGKLDWESDDLVVRLIKKHFPEDMWDVLIKKTEKPRKDGLNGLPVADLKRIGVTAEETGDQIVVKPMDSEIDKLVDALLREDETPEAA